MWDNSESTQGRKQEWIEEFFRASSDRREHLLSTWISDPNLEFTPNSNIRCLATDPCGEWMINRGFSSSTISIRLLRNHEYGIEFCTFGCTDRWKLLRTAIFADGVLKLNRPVFGYDDTQPFDKLYAVRIGSDDKLSPSCPQNGSSYYEFVRYLKNQEINSLGK
jgi:hypothetical protein